MIVMTHLLHYRVSGVKKKNTIKIIQLSNQINHVLKKVEYNGAKNSNIDFRSQIKKPEGRKNF